MSTRRLTAVFWCVMAAVGCDASVEIGPSGAPPMVGNEKFVSNGGVEIGQVLGPMPVDGGPAAMLEYHDYRFPCRLYSRLRRVQDGNLFFSPVSISTAMAMAYAGARGTTADEMKQALLLDGTPDETHAKFAKLLADLRSERAGCRLDVANRLWGQKDYAFLPEFIRINREQYGADPVELDFSGASDEAIRSINGWVNEQTHQMIPEIVTPDAVNSGTRLVLTNAIYFRGDWLNKFEQKDTRKAPFHVDNERQVDVQLMFQSDVFRLTRMSGVRVLELPYQGNRQSMLILLPDSIEGLSDIESRLTNDLLNQWISQLYPTEVDVYLPKFHAQSEFHLAKLMQSLGMKTAFEPGSADFRGMSETGELFLSDVIHKAVVDVHEEGTEAAAATAVTAMGGAPPETEIFRVDRPFVFLIYDHSIRTMLFMGRVVDPSRT